MSKHNPYPNENDLSVRVMVGDPLASAYMWLVAYNENINSYIRSQGSDDDPDDDYYDLSELTLDELIDTAMTHVVDSDRWGGEYITRGGLFEGFSLDPTFWDKLAILKEIDIPSDRRSGIFSCSC